MQIGESNSSGKVVHWEPYLKVYQRVAKALGVSDPEKEDIEAYAKQDWEKDIRHGVRTTGAILTML